MGDTGRFWLLGIFICLASLSGIKALHVAWVAHPLDVTACFQWLGVGVIFFFLAVLAAPRGP